MVSWRPDAIVGLAEFASSRQVDALLLIVSATFAFAVVPGVAFYGGMYGPGAVAAFRASISGAAVVVGLAMLGGVGLIVAGAHPRVHRTARLGNGLPLVAQATGSAADAYPLARAGYVIALCALWRRQSSEPRSLRASPCGHGWSSRSSSSAPSYSRPVMRFSPPTGGRRAGCR